MRRLLTPLYRLQRAGWRLFRPRTRGVKVMLFNAGGELLLVRHSYGRSDQYMLPGGGVRPFERPEAAAVREMREELGCTLEQLAFVSVHASSYEGKRDTVFLFRACAAGAIRPDGVEIEEARFFALTALPASVSPATLRRIEEYRGDRMPDERW